ADLYFRGRPVAFYALDLPNARGAIGIVDEDNIDEEQVLALEPLVELRGTVEIAEASLAENRVFIYAFDPRAPIAIARSVRAGGGAFSFHFPPGAYKLTLSAKDLQRVTREVVLEPGTGVLDLGAIDLFATNLAEHYGKPPPEWNVTEARGVSPDVRLSDYRGRWVLIEFWSYW
ncbi:MAG: TlpA family protein disulfide reductase, partial [Planctomycetota bacterium]